MGQTEDDMMPGFVGNGAPVEETFDPTNAAHHVARDYEAREAPPKATAAAGAPVATTVSPATAGAPANETHAPIPDAQFDPISAPPGAPPRQPVPHAVHTAPPPSLALVKTEPNYGLVTEDLQPLDLRGAITVSQWLFEGKMYPQFTSKQAVFSIIARGKELGVGMTTALAGMHMVEGKPTASADLIRALAKRDPKCKYFRLVASTPLYAEWETWSSDDPEPTRYRYDLEEAHQAGLRNGNWQKRPRDMLAKTASSKLARLVYPGATLGLYAPEEMGEDREAA